jgi:hypothetical protein
VTIEDTRRQNYLKKASKFNLLQMLLLLLLPLFQLQSSHSSQLSMGQPSSRKFQGEISDSDD